MDKFRPKCMNTTTQMAVDNRGRLLPCCYIDTPKWIQFEEIKKLLSVSDIAKNKSIKDIVSSKEWVEFHSVLKEGDIDEIPAVCKHHCLDGGEDKLKVEKWFDLEGTMYERKGK